MTRDEAIKRVRIFGMMRGEADLRERLPAGRCNEICDIIAEDEVDMLIALGLLIVDQPSPEKS
jgi:hypothetical protein